MMFSLGNMLSILALAPIAVLGQTEVPSLQETLAHMVEADADADRKLSPNEFVTFIKLMATGSAEKTAELADVNVFSDLYLQAKADYAFLACLCRVPEVGGDEATADTCCVAQNAHVRVPSQPFETDVRYLDRVYETILHEIYGIPVEETAAIDQTVGEVLDEESTVEEPAAEETTPATEPTDAASPDTFASGANGTVAVATNVTSTDATANATGTTVSVAPVDSFPVDNGGMPPGLAIPIVAGMMAGMTVAIGAVIYFMGWHLDDEAGEALIEQKEEEDN